MISVWAKQWLVDFNSNKTEAMLFTLEKNITPHFYCCLIKHKSGKELFIRFTASAFRKLLSIYVFSCFPLGFEGRMWDLIVSVPDHCLSFYFVNHHKHLGITFSRDGKWHEHINTILSSASKILGMMRKLKFTLHRKALNQIYV